MRQFIIVLGRTQFVGSEFEIFGGFGRVCSSFLVGKQGFRRVRSLYLELSEPWQSLETPKSYYFSSIMCIVLPNITHKEKNSIN